ncbi:hypothetical protein J437_LFUL014942 [Ladona fulva]|uniref:RNA-directed DNA polymerase n=1 Tax=Ladona fulva TaxID=123851 RepID=A0A8K0KN69_LADFU|nr:hypothetical protein J437_LFUL014942 [Ladona fulva]
MVVPHEHRSALLEENHDNPTGGHLGLYKTYNRLRRFYFWPSMKGDVSRHIKRCKSCQQYKTERKKNAGEMQPKDLTPPWSIVATDIVGPLPRSRTGHRYVLVFLDTATRWPIAIPLRRVTSEDVAKALLNDVINHWGCPEVLLADNGPQFRSKILRRACEAYGIQLLHTTPYHPRANPTERCIQTLKTMIAIHCRGSQKTWDENIPHLMFTLRTARQETTGFSPAYLNLGRELRAPNEAFRELSDANRAPFEPSSYHQNLKDRLTKCYDSAKNQMRQASQRQARYFNLRRRNVDFPVGALVWRRNHVLSDAAKSRSAKLEPKFIGPFKVRRKATPTVYELETLRGKAAGAIHVEDIRGEWCNESFRPFVSPVARARSRARDLAEEETDRRGTGDTEAFSRSQV